MAPSPRPDDLPKRQVAFDHLFAAAASRLQADGARFPDMLHGFSAARAALSRGNNPQPLAGQQARRAVQLPSECRSVWTRCAFVRSIIDIITITTP